MKLNWLIPILALASTAAQAIAFESLPRFSPSNTASIPIPVYKIPAPTGQEFQNCEAYLFKDSRAYQSLWSKDQNGILKLNPSVLAPMQEAALLLDRVIYPRFTGIFPKEVLAKGTPKITLIFDNLDPASIHKGYVSRRYSAEIGLNTMIVDASLTGTPGFSVIAAHELQHIFNYFFSVQNGAAELQEDWLNEGLSQFMEFYIAGAAPDAALSKFANQGQTPSLLHWPSDSEVSEDHYTNAFLWISYLYYHFGRDELLWRLIAKPHTGLESVISTLVEMNGKYFQVPTQFLTPASLFANYALALAINSKTTGINRLFGFTDDAFMPALSSFKIDPQLTLLPLRNKISPMQATYFTPSETNMCLSFGAPQGVYAYLIETVLETKRVARMVRIDQGTCTKGGANRTHEIVIFNVSDSNQEFSLTRFFPLQ